MLLSGMPIMSAQTPPDQDFNLETAVKFLSTTKSMGEYYPLAIEGVKDPKTKAEMMKLFKQQLAAIAAIGASHKQINLSVLFPFLDIDTSGNPGVFEYPTTDVNQLRSWWPVTAVILDMPGAAESLEKFTLDKKNPVNYRLDAFLMLSYVDKTRIKNVAYNLTKEFQSSSEKSKQTILIIISDVQAGHNGFGGGFSLPE